MPHGSILGANKIQTRSYRFYRADHHILRSSGAQKMDTAVSYAPRFSHLASQVIVLSEDTQRLPLPASAAERRPHLCQSVGPRRSLPIMQYI